MKKNNIELKAPAKINLNLQILNKREDGYHDIKSEFQTIDLCDEIKLTAISTGIQLKTSGNYRIPNNRDNLVYQVAEQLRVRAKGKVGVKIELNKQIPLFAGLGGGSSDAATVLQGLNKLWDLNLSIEKQIEIGKKIGADIPFFLYGGCCLVEGIGEKVTPLDCLEKKYVVVAQLPYIKISTPWAYSQFDKLKIPLEGDKGCVRPQGKNIIPHNQPKIKIANAAEKEFVKKIREEKLLRPKGFTNETDWGYKKGEEVLVAANQDKIIGHVGFLQNENHIHIRTLFVEEKFRQKGIGSQLIQHITELSAKNNLEKITVYAEQKAIEFYQKNGFEKTGEDKAANGVVYPIMERRLHKTDIIQENNKKTFRALNQQQNIQVQLGEIEPAKNTTNYLPPTTNSTNDFEKVIFPHFPDLKDLKESFLKNGAEQANMTGSGSAVYGLFEKKEIAEKCLKKIEDRCEFIYLGKTINTAKHRLNFLRTYS